MSADTFCRCWTEPARVHPGHCCMAIAAATCHEKDGLAAHVAAESSNQKEA
jgi:hypothetical protein